MYRVFDLGVPTGSQCFPQDVPFNTTLQPICFCPKLNLQNLYRMEGPFFCILGTSLLQDNNEKTRRLLTHISLLHGSNKAKEKEKKLN